MIRLAILFFIHCIYLNADDSLLFNANARMIPKIMALDTQLLSKCKSGKAVLAVVYDNQKSQALNITEQMNKNYGGKVSTISFSAIAVTADELLSMRNVSYLFLMPMHPQTTAKIAAWATANSIASFSFNTSDLDLGVLGSISIERQTIIYINKKALKQGNLRFNDALFQIARFVE